MEILGVAKEAILQDLPVAVLLAFWNLFVILVLAKEVYEYALKKGRTEHSATYFGRKVIHFLSGGLSAILLPFYFHEPILPLILALTFTVMTYIPHKTGRLMYWFQDKENMYEVHFTIVWAAIIFFTWYLDQSFWLGVVPVLFMAWGDGITGVIRNLKYGKRVKAWEGTVGMMALDIVIGARFGVIGIIAAVVTALIERISFLDDNITVPTVALILLLIGKYLIPGLAFPII